MILWSRNDITLAAAIGIAAAVIGIGVANSFARAGHAAEFYQAQFGPAVMLACGRGFVNPPLPGDGHSPPVTAHEAFATLDAFLANNQATFDCNLLPAQFETRPLTPFQSGHRYLLGLASALWYVFGISWTAVRLLPGLFVGLSAALLYLLARVAMAPLLALIVCVIWLTSPLHYSYIPHLRDYGKAPFFMLALCCIAWLTLVRASRSIAVAVLAGVGAVLGFGFGVRTDVASYLLFVIATALVCRPELNREDVVTRIVAATAALLAFCVVAFPVIRAYESGDNMAHVAVLGMTDASREWLRVREAPYSFGYLYHDGYAAAVISAFAERDDRLLTPVYIGTPGYASAGNEYYGRLIQTFSGDFLTRAWAAVAAVLQMPFEEAYHVRPPWIPSALDGLFAAREKILETISFLPPIVAALAFWAGIALRSVWLAVFFVVFFVLVSGMTSIQFQGRHVFHLEVLPLVIYGALIHRLVAALRQHPPLALPPRAFVVKLGLLVSTLIAAMVVPVAVARAYQEERVADLLSAYTAADVRPIERRAEPTGVDRVLFDASLAPSESPPNFIDTNVIRLAVGGNECDVDTVALTFRYQTRPPFADFSRESLVPAPPPGSPPTLVVFPVYSLGLRSTLRDHFRFVGIEVASGMENCVVAFERFSTPNQFPLLLETVLLPDWRERPLYETLREYEPGPAEWIRTLYAAPANARPGRRWLTQLAPVTAAATFRSSQVERLESGAIDARGRARTSSAYLVSWPYEHRVKGSAFFVEGEIFDGGMTIGIQQNEQWVQQLNIPRPGRFRAVIRVEADGTYGAVLANYQLRGLYHRSTITRYGWLPPQQ